jgi:hypothetical protein
MKPALLALVAIAVSSPSLAQTSRATTVDTFQCVTTRPFEGTRPAKVAFRIANIADRKKLDFYVEGPVTDETRVVRISPKNSGLDALNDLSSGDAGVSLRKTRDGKVVLRLYGNAIDIHTAEIVLYADSDFRAGYAKVTDLGGYGVGNHYSTIRCERTSIAVR